MLVLQNSKMSYTKKNLCFLQTYKKFEYIIFKLIKLIKREVKVRKDNIVNIIEISQPFDCNEYRLNFVVCYSHVAKFPKIKLLDFYINHFEACIHLVTTLLNKSRKNMPR